MDKCKQEEYKKFAVDTVIKYAKEQGVKLRYSDFPVYSTNRTENLVIFYDCNNPFVEVFISIEGRWTAQLRKAQDGFLNYVNARVMKTGVKFTFTVDELDLLKTKDTQADEDMEKVIRKITKLLALSDLDRNPSENEAIAASLAAQKFLQNIICPLRTLQGNMTQQKVLNRSLQTLEQGRSGNIFYLMWLHRITLAERSATERRELFFMGIRRTF